MEAASVTANKHCARPERSQRADRSVARRRGRRLRGPAGTGRWKPGRDSVAVLRRLQIAQARTTIRRRIRKGIGSSSHRVTLTVIAMAKFDDEVPGDSAISEALKKIAKERGWSDELTRRIAEARVPAIVALFVDLVRSFAGSDGGATRMARADDDRRLARARRDLGRQRGIFRAVVRFARGDRGMGNYCRARARRIRAIQVAAECSNPDPAARP